MSRLIGYGLVITVIILFTNSPLLAAEDLVDEDARAAEKARVVKTLSQFDSGIVKEVADVISQNKRVITGTQSTALFGKIFKKDPNKCKNVESETCSDPKCQKTCTCKTGGGGTEYYDCGCYTNRDYCAGGGVGEIVDVYGD